MSGAIIYVQFSDFDGSSNMIHDVPMCRIPAVGEQLNVRFEDMTYFLEVESITNFVDCDSNKASAHTITIDGKLLRSTPRHVAEASA